MLVAGLMSGTSADGIDVALTEINGLGWKTGVRVVAFHSIPYPPLVRRKVLEVAAGTAIPAGEISQLNFLLGTLFAEACQQACRRSRIAVKRVKLIGSHGQTIYHHNRTSSFCGFATRSTLQIADIAVIAEQTGVITIGDFRTADIAAGGQGAPLVPFFDYLFYRHPRRGRILLNIGGIANLTAIPAGGSPDEVIAFDTGPGNMILDALASSATGGKQSYDAEGKLARAGNISAGLLNRLMRQPYFREKPPKTAGREQFGREFLKKYFLDPNPPLAISDALATATAFTAETIARGIKDFVLTKFPVAECLVSGGGVKNTFLMEALSERLNRSEQRSRLRAPIRVIPADSAGIPSDAKEAVAFAVLAYQTFHQRPSNLCAATGAHHPAILGKIAYPAHAAK